MPGQGSASLASWRRSRVRTFLLHKTQALLSGHVRGRWVMALPLLAYTTHDTALHTQTPVADCRTCCHTMHDLMHHHQIS